MTIKKAGTALGKDIVEVVLSNDWMAVHILNLGCTIQKIWMPDIKGKPENIVSGYNDIGKYINNPAYFGSVIGRYANRINRGKFTCGGVEVQLPTNDRGNHLHGGFQGFDKKVFSIVEQKSTEEFASIKMEYLSPDGEEGYPGNLHVNATYTLSTDNSLDLLLEAETDLDTPVNLTNHSYFNLSGFRELTIADHWLQVFSSSYTETDELDIPTGSIKSVTNTTLDYSMPASLRHSLETSIPNGLNVNYVLNRKGVDPSLSAILYDQRSCRTLAIHTNQPGLQVYTAGFWDGTISGTHESPYQKFGAIALEPQAFPDAPNHPGFPDSMLKPGMKYANIINYRFSINEKFPSC